jgi:transposase
LRGAAVQRPRVLLALWLYATSQGVSSARRLSELCTSDLAYMWLCGDETINAHTLSDFRRHGAKALETCAQHLRHLSWNSFAN